MRMVRRAGLSQSRSASVPAKIMEIRTGRGTLGKKPRLRARRRGVCEGIHEVVCLEFE